MPTPSTYTVEVETITHLNPNEIARMDDFIMATTTTNLIGKELDACPRYVQLAITKARRAHPHFDPNWRKAHGYAAMI